MTNKPNSRLERFQRILAYMVASIIGVSILCFLAIIIGTFSGMTGAQFGEGLWPVIAWVPYVGLPLGFLLILVLLFLSLRRRSKEAPETR